MSKHRKHWLPHSVDGLVLNGFSGTLEVINHGEMLVSFEVSAPHELEPEADPAEPDSERDTSNHEGEA